MATWLVVYPLNEMKTTTIILLLLTCWTKSFAQDGSDIRYLKTSLVDSTFIGEYVHFDFYHRSFGGILIDTISIGIDNVPTKFIEVRKDNGYNNWFSQQSMQSIENIDGLTMRISKFKLDNITTNSFKVIMYLDYYDTKNKLLNDKSKQIAYWFDKKDIKEVLIMQKKK